MITPARTHAHRARLASGVALIAAAGLALAGCASPSPDSSGAANGGEGREKVTLIVHNSFPNEEFAAAASAATGYEVEVVSAGDGGELSAQLVLSQGAPVADAYFGIDSTFASRIMDAGVTEPFTPAQPLSARGESIVTALLSDAESASASAYPMVPITLGATCMNIDPAWFEAEGLAEPRSYDDLADEQYRGLSVVLDPTSSSTGASFLTGTVAKFGEDGFAEYWERLAANDTRIVQGWEEAYYTDFTGSGGTYPIVLSYSSSPAYTVTEDGTATTTKALLDTCSSQIEYAGVLAGAANPEGAAAVVDYMLSREFQDTIAETMYVNPVDEDAYLPAEWEEFAPFPEAPNDMTPVQISEGRESWLKTWSDATGW